MAKLMNKRDALKYIASVTSTKDKEKVKTTLKTIAERLQVEYGDKVKPIAQKNAVKAYYHAIISEAFKDGNIITERAREGKKTTKYIRKGTIDKAIKKIQNTDYYSTSQERWRRTLLQGYEDMGYDRKGLRDLLGVTKLRPEYFEYVKMDDDGQEVVRYEDKIVYIKFVRNDLGETIDIILAVEEIQGPFPEGVKRRRYSV